MYQLCEVERVCQQITFEWLLRVVGPLLGCVCLCNQCFFLSTAKVLDKLHSVLQTVGENPSEVHVCLYC